MKRAQPRMTWYAGTRSEALLLGRMFKEHRAQKGGAATHRFITTGAQGTPLIQALDALALRPDDAMELLPPDDDPAIRLRKLMETIERDARRHRATHLVFSGFGPTAAACALVAHGRNLQGLWLKPSDACGLIARSRWERGLARLTESLECVTVEECRRPPSVGFAPTEGFTVEGRRAEAPLVLVSVGRETWGWDGTLGRLVNALGAAARTLPEADIVILLSMDMRLHAPLRSMEDRPPNLLATAPLPPPDYLALLSRSRVALTDSPHVASECLARGVGVLALGETETATSKAHPCRPITPARLAADVLPEVLSDLLRECEGPVSREENPSSIGILSPVIGTWLE